MIPGRRRVRLLAAGLLFVVVALVYTRRAQVETYAEYASEKVVGGGAVLRSDRVGMPEEQQAAALPSAEPPAPVAQAPSRKPEPRPTTSIAAIHEGPSSSKMEQATSTTSEQTMPPTGSTSAPAVINLGADEEDLPIQVEEGRKEITQSYTATPIHWSPSPEQFPLETTIQLPTGSPKPIPKIQYSGDDAGKADISRLSAIKAATEHAWYGYRDAAFGNDEVKPVSGGSNNPFNGWGATLVDSLDTLWMMGMNGAFDEAVDMVRTIDFTTSLRSDIPLFETTIRYLGGLIAAYDISGKQQKYSILLDKAVELAEIMYAAFDTPNRMPQTFYRWKPAYASQPHRASNRVVLAELGSMSLEFTRLAQLTGEPKYFDAIQRITDALDEWQNKTRLPGMWPLTVDASGCEKPVQVSHIRSGLGDSEQVLSFGGDGQVMSAGRPIEATRPAGNKDPSSGRAEKQKSDSGIGTERPETNKKSALPNSLEGTVMSKENRVEHHSSNILGSNKAKRQLDYSNIENSKYTERKNGTIHESSPNDSPLRKVELRDPVSSDRSEKRTGQEVCLPKGLGSTSKRAMETFSLGGQSDSTYEYLPKEYLLLGGHADQYKNMYERAANAITESLIFKPMTIDNRDILISGTMKVTVNISSGGFIYNLYPELEHLTCFAGGMFAMAGKIFNRPGDIDIGRKLTDGCVWAYESTTTGIMPEMLTAMECEKREGDCPWNQTAYWRSLDPYMHTRTRKPVLAGGAVVATSTSDKPVAATNTKEAERAFNKRDLDDGEVREKASPVQLPDKSVGIEDESDMLRAAPLAHSTESPAPAQPSQKPTTSSTQSPNRVNNLHYTPKPPLPHEEFVQKKIEEERLPPGFTKLNSRKYILRPEAIESVFYMYRITGDPYWREVGWNMFIAIDTHTRALFGNAAIDDVTKTAPELKDTMESFWIAETLKYFYLLFDDANNWSLDDWVLNTEAHFFRRPK